MTDQEREITVETKIVSLNPTGNVYRSLIGRF